MDEKRTRRGAAALLGAAGVAFADLRSAAATGGGNCRGAGGNCSGSQQCCGGLVCTPTGNGSSKTCQAPATCETCPDLTVIGSCLVQKTVQATANCETRYGVRRHVPCEKRFDSTRSRNRCHRRNERRNVTYQRCTSNVQATAFAYCGVVIS